MSINLLKRLESSVHSFQLTLMRIKKLIDGTIQSIDQFERSGHADLDMYDMAGDDFDMDDENTGLFHRRQKSQNRSCGYGLEELA